MESHSVQTDGAAEEARLSALLEYDILDTEVESVFDDLVHLTAHCFNTPIAAISLIASDRQWSKASVGLPSRQLPRDVAFCNESVRTGSPLVIPDTHKDPRFAQNPLVAGDTQIRFYAGVPLMTPEGYALGTLCVMNTVPRDFHASDLTILTTLAHQVGAQLQLRKQSEPERALRGEQQLNRQIVENSPIGVSIFDGDGFCITTNAAMANLVGTTQSQLRAQNFHELASWKMSGLYALAKHTLETGERSTGVLPIASAFGKRLVLAVDFSILSDTRAGHLMLMAQDLTDIYRSDEARKELEERFEKLFIHSHDGILLGRDDGSIMAANPALCAMLGVTEEALVRSHRTAIIDVTDGRLQPMLDERSNFGTTRGALRVVRANGETFEAEISSVMFKDGQGRNVTSSIFRDITERQELELRLRDSLNLLNSLAQRVPGLMYQFQRFPDGRSCFPFASEGIEEIYEVRPEDIRHDASLVIARIHPDDAPGVFKSIAASERELSPWHMEYRVVLPRQGVRWRIGDADPERLADGSVLWHGFISDITERKANEDSANRLAYYDSLTGLPNRRLLLDRIEQGLSTLRRNRKIGALMYLDLDEFKRINDARGHAIGDTLLKQVAQRLSDTLRDEDTVARIGGDEFVVLINDLAVEQVDAERGALLIAEKIREALDQPYSIAGKPYNSSATLGITLFPRGNETVDDLLREADTAMYRAKEAGRNRVAFFEPAMQAEVEDRLALEHDLKRAISLNQLSLDVQGQFDSTGALAGAELLARWNDEVRGVVPPNVFIPIAESSGLIVRLGEWVLEQACRTLVRLSAAGACVPLSINVSPRQFHSEHFVERVAAILANTGVAGELLIFEVTEGLLLLGDQGQGVSRMAKLVKLGIRFSVDDFGTGYSNLAYLKDLPLFELKIDKRFVHGAQLGSAETAIVKVILSLAALFNLRVVAEGVETREQADFLISSGCGYLQGFLLARPRPLEDWVAAQMKAPGSR